MPLQSFKDLQVWQRGMELVKEIYLVTSHFPEHERYGLTSQMQRAAVSIPSNISEGYERGTTKDYVRFLRIALGSVAELYTQLEVTQMIYHSINVDVASSHLTEVRNMLKAMIRKLEV